MRYMVVIEKGTTGDGAFVPGLPGCIAVGETEAEVLELIQEAIQFHLEDLQLQPQGQVYKQLQPQGQVYKRCLCIDLDGEVMPLPGASVQLQSRLHLRWH